MRSGLDLPKLREFMEQVGRSAKGPGRIYLVGGATALLLGIRNQTIDVDIKLDPEPKGVFEAIATLKERLQINVELASPDQFLPPLPGWAERSEFIMKAGEVDIFHYDFYSQTLAKISRGYGNDLVDAHALVRLGKIDVGKLLELFEKIQPDLIRYPAVNGSALGKRIGAFADEAKRT